MKTLIELFIDSSGSMATIADAVRSGVREYVDELRSSTSVGEVLIRITTFAGGGDPSPGSHTRGYYDDPDHNYRQTGIIPITQFEGLSLSHFNPGGMTPLLDCLARRINDTKRDIEASPFGGPDRVLFVIWTDGAENASKYTKIQDVQKLVQERQTGFNSWQFVFLGANLDQFAQGFQLGGQTLATNSFAYVHTNEGVRSATRSLANATVAFCASTNRTSDDFFADVRDEEEGKITSSGSA